MIQKVPENNNCNTIHRRNRFITGIWLAISICLFVTAYPSKGYPARKYPVAANVYTTREQTVSPISITGANQLNITQVDQYEINGYSLWQPGPGVDDGPRLPDGSVPAAYTSGETILSFFSLSDAHITDKESTAQALYLGVDSDFGSADTNVYSPAILSSTQVLDAAVQTINALHKETPFDFGISLGDNTHSNQYNELRWFMDVMDGKTINPSSGARKGAATIDYQKPYKAAGLDKSISWYQVIGNNDQYWLGYSVPNDYVRSVLLGSTLINVGLAPGPDQLDTRGYYMGVIDGATQYGTISKYGVAGTMAAPIVAADRTRHALTTDTSTSLNWMKEFFNTTSYPKGHGFTQANLSADFASYSFEPKASVPLKVIVLDDTCKPNPHAGYTQGCIDQTRYEWLVDELDRGQAEGKLMIVAAHVPVGPQWSVPDDPIVPVGITYTTVVPTFFSTCNTTPDNIGVPCDNGVAISNNDPAPPYSVVSDATLLSTLHNYSNLILWIAGHRHRNTVTPQPAPAGKTAEFGFWEVETASLRDFPQHFRTFEIVRNDNNTLSIFVTNVDPAVQGVSPAARSRGYAIGAYRIANGILDDTTSHAYNAELIKPLPAPHTLTVVMTGPGTVKSSPYSGINCVVNGPCSGTFLPGTPVTLVATPAAGAAFSGWSTCTGKSACGVTMSSDITVTADFTCAATAVISPTYKDFGAIKTGKSANTTFTVRNTTAKGVVDMVLGTISFGGSDAGQFALAPGKDTCSGKTLKSNTACTFQVLFNPTSVNTKYATVSIPSNDPAGTKVIQITGVGK